MVQLNNRKITETEPDRRGPSCQLPGLYTTGYGSSRIELAHVGLEYGRARSSVNLRHRGLSAVDVKSNDSKWKEKETKREED